MFLKTLVRAFGAKVQLNPLASNCKRSYPAVKIGSKRPDEVKETKPAVKPEPKQETKPVVKEAKPAQKQEPKQEAKPVAKETKPAVKQEIKTEVKKEVKQTLKQEVKVETKPVETPKKQPVKSSYEDVIVLPFFSTW